MCIRDRRWGLLGRLFVISVLAIAVMNLSLIHISPLRLGLPPLGEVVAAHRRALAAQHRQLRRLPARAAALAHSLPSRAIAGRLPVHEQQHRRHTCLLYTSRCV